MFYFVDSPLWIMALSTLGCPADVSEILTVSEILFAKLFDDVVSSASVIVLNKPS